MNKLIILIASFFGVLLIITTYSLYDITCLMKRTRLSNTLENNMGSISHPRVSKILCISAKYDSLKQTTMFTVRNQQLATDIFFEYLKHYDMLIIGRYILKIGNVSRTRDTITFEGSFVDKKTKLFNPLTAYDMFSRDVKRLNNAILVVLHISSVV